MGTYSYFRMEIVDNSAGKIIKGEQKHQIIQALFDDPSLDPHKFAEDALTLDGTSNNEAKWYDAQQDLEIFSKAYPEYIFILAQQLCAPDSEEEEGEFFLAIHNGTARGIHEPGFMKPVKLFDSKQAMKDAFLVMDVGNQLDIVFRSTSQGMLDLVYEKLKNTSFKDQTHTTFTLMSGGGGSSITTRIQPEQIDGFWQEAASVLVS